MLETKKAIKRERYLIKFLSQFKVAKLLSGITSLEFIPFDKSKSFDMQPLAMPQGLSDISTVPATIQASNAENPTPSRFPRVESAVQMILFPTEEDGPKPGQMSRAIHANIDAETVSFMRKDVFYVYSEENPEEEYKRKIDYNNPVLLRPKAEGKESETLGKLPSLPTAETMSAFTHVTRRTTRSESDLEAFQMFQFWEYGLKIITNMCER